MCSVFLAFALAFHLNLPSYLQALTSGKKALGKHGYIKRHAHSETHRAAEEKAALFLQTRHPGANIHARITKQVTEQQVRTYKGILSTIDVFLA